ncbi:MAG: hypothetical protein K1X94_03800 [Sandaracinaceae bacterium]|nr:hypothetical protein [Sandaracinaceae bacterium]
MRPLLLGSVFLSLLGSLVAPPLAAEDVSHEPTHCADVVTSHPAPPRIEWGAWIGGGFSLLGIGPPGAERGALRLGAEVDFPLGSIRATSLRLGPYVLVETTFDALVAEAGVELDLGPARHGSHGATWLRLGGGGGASARGEIGFLSLTYAIGLESVAERIHRFGCCVNLEGSCAPRPAREHAYTPIARFFVILRATFVGELNGMLVVGLELDPWYFEDRHRETELGID